MRVISKVFGSKNDMFSKKPLDISISPVEVLFKSICQFYMDGIHHTKEFIWKDRPRVYVLPCPDHMNGAIPRCMNHRKMSVSKNPRNKNNDFNKFKSDVGDKDYIIYYKSVQNRTVNVKNHNNIIDTTSNKTDKFDSIKGSSICQCDELHKPKHCTHKIRNRVFVTNERSPSKTWQNYNSYPTCNQKRQIRKRVSGGGILATTLNTKERNLGIIEFIQPPVLQKPVISKASKISYIKIIKPVRSSRCLRFQLNRPRSISVYHALSEERAEHYSERCDRNSCSYDTEFGASDNQILGMESTKFNDTALLNDQSNLCACVYNCEPEINHTSTHVDKYASFELCNYCTHTPVLSEHSCALGCVANSCIYISKKSPTLVFTRTAPASNTMCQQPEDSQIQKFGHNSTSILELNYLQRNCEQVDFDPHCFQARVSSRRRFSTVSSYETVEILKSRSCHSCSNCVQSEAQLHYGIERNHDCSIDIGRSGSFHNIRKDLKKRYVSSCYPDVTTISIDNIQNLRVSSGNLEYVCSDHQIGNNLFNCTFSNNHVQIFTTIFEKPNFCKGRVFTQKDEEGSFVAGENDFNDPGYSIPGIYNNGNSSSTGNIPSSIELSEKNPERFQKVTTKKNSTGSFNVKCLTKDPINGTEIDFCSNDTSVGISIKDECKKQYTPSLTAYLGIYKLESVECPDSTAYIKENGIYSIPPETYKINMSPYQINNSSSYLYDYNSDNKYRIKNSNLLKNSNDSLTSVTKDNIFGATAVDQCTSDTELHDLIIKESDGQSPSDDFTMNYVRKSSSESRFKRRGSCIFVKTVSLDRIDFLSFGDGGSSQSHDESYISVDQNDSELIGRESRSGAVVVTQNEPLETNLQLFSTLSDGVDTSDEYFLGIHRQSSTSWEEGINKSGY